MPRSSHSKFLKNYFTSSLQEDDEIDIYTNNNNEANFESENNDYEDVFNIDYLVITIHESCTNDNANSEGE